MYTVYTNERLFAVVDLMEGTGGSRFEILEYKEVKKNGAPLRQIRIVLNEGEARSAENVLQFFKGKIGVKIKPGEGGAAAEILRKAVTGILAKESLVKQPLMLPVYNGVGEIYLKPSYHHYQLLWLDREEIIVDEEVFLACDTTISVSPVRIKLPATEGKEEKVILQKKLSGTGACVLELPVSPREIMCLPLFDEKIRLEGFGALLRKGNVQLNVTGQEDSVTYHFSGTGEVWLTPTRDVR